MVFELKNVLGLASFAMLLSACAPSNEQVISNKSIIERESLLKRSSSQIVNGEIVSENDPISKSTVSIYFLISEEDGTAASICTGTLIKKNVILTAAHCLKDASELDLNVPIKTFVSRLRVGFGPKIVGNISNREVSFLKINKYIIHPRYTSGSVKTALEKEMPDIALLQLEEDAPDSYEPAILGTDSDLIKEGTIVTLAGYGIVSGVNQTSATQLMKVNVRIDFPKLTSVQFGFLVVNGKTSCSGDSGGPAYLKTKSGMLVVVGVTSWGDLTCEKVGVYTSVSALSGFITDSIANL